MFSMKLKKAILFYGCQWTKIDSPPGKLVGIFLPMLGSWVGEVLWQKYLSIWWWGRGRRCLGQRKATRTGLCWPWALRVSSIGAFVFLWESREQWHLEKVSHEFCGFTAGAVLTVVLGPCRAWESGWQRVQPAAAKVLMHASDVRS